MKPGEYAAVVNIPFPASLVASPDLIRSKLEERGFSDVAIAEDKPAGFPLASEGDYYLRVTWPSDPKLFDVPRAVVEHRQVA